MSTEEPLTIATAKGRMKLSSLRPGDWLMHADEETEILVLVNSSKLQRLVLQYSGIKETEDSWEYRAVTTLRHRYIGHGPARRWHKFLPRWLRKRVCPYAAPQPAKKNRA